MTILDLTIDASMIAVPHPVESADQVCEYVDILRELSTLASDPKVSVHLSERAADALIESKLYPMHDRLSELISIYNVEQYSSHDVEIVVNRLLNLRPSFEAHHGIIDVLAEPLETTPRIIKLSAHENMKVSMERSTLLVAILIEHIRNPPVTYALVLRSAPNAVVDVQAKIHALEHDRSDILDPPLAPKLFTGSVLVCDDFNKIVGHLNESDIFRKALDKLDSQGIEVAIRVALHKDYLGRNEIIDWHDMKIPKFDTKFLESCRESIGRLPRGSLVGTILRVIVDTIMGERDKKRISSHHALNRGKRGGGGGPQIVRKRDGAQAYRAKIGRALRLHYWRSGSYSIELKTVTSKHDDFHIPE